MLVLARKLGEKLVLGDNIVITVLQVRGNQVRLGVQAPAGVRILRGELALPAEAADGNPAQAVAPAACG
jgi:carbon storage regulator